MDERHLQWHRDADTSRTIRICWSIGVGTLLAALTLIVFGRLFAFGAQTGVEMVVVAALGALAVTILALAVAGRPAERLSTLADLLPGVEYTPDETDGSRVSRGIDAAVGAVVMGTLIFALDAAGGPQGEMLAAATIPIALVFVLISVFLRSTGVYDPEEGIIYLYDPEDAIDLDHLEGVSARYVGATAIARLRYRTLDGEYVPGPRRLVLPPTVARELETAVGD